MSTRKFDKTTVSSTKKHLNFLFGREDGTKEFGTIDESSFLEDQLDLTEEELKKDVTIILTSENPYFSKNSVEWSFKDKEFKPVTNFSHTTIIYSQEGPLIHKETFEQEKMGKESKMEKRRNKFNFQDRAVQTFNNAMKDQAVEVKPPPTTRIGVNATLMDMTEAYEEKKTTKEEKPKKEPELADCGFTVKVLERMLNQIEYSDAILDFGFYDNPCDKFIDNGLGSLLPLWDFEYEKTKNMAAMSISWNPFYSDMFAVSYGTKQFFSDLEGHICFYTLKRPLYPEKIYHCHASVQSVAFHHQWSHLIVAGFSDGVVAVYDLLKENDFPLAISGNTVIEHTDVVTKVNWLDDNLERQHTFCSISGDGKVIKWTVTEGDLIPIEISLLKNDACEIEGPEGFLMNATSLGVTSSFRNHNSELFLVGTEDSLIHKCSSLYYNKYLSTYRDHTYVVNMVEWNPFHPKVFVSCSEDWTIRVWNHERELSIFMFDLYSSVKVVTWAPFSSTLFGAVTRDGKVHIFDLSMNRQTPTCTYSYGQKNVPCKIHLTSLAFNPNKPIIAVGDDKGAILTFKLSPNLRSSLQDYNEMERSKFVAQEIEKLDKILRLATK